MAAIDSALIRYHPHFLGFRQEFSQALKHPDSVISPVDFTDEFSNQSTEADLYKTVISKYRMHFLEKMRASGAKVAMSNLAELRKSMTARKQEVPDWMLREGIQLDTHDVVIGHRALQNFYFANFQRKQTVDFFQEMLVGEGCFLGAGQLFFWKENGEYHFRIPDEDFLIGAFRLAHVDRDTKREAEIPPYVVPEFVIGKDSLLSRRMKIARGVHPVDVSPIASKTHGMDGFDKFLDAYHDFFHIMKLNSMLVQSDALEFGIEIDEIRQDLLLFFDILYDMPWMDYITPELYEDLLDATLDGVSPLLADKYFSVFRIWDIMISRAERMNEGEKYRFVSYMRRKLESELKAHPRKDQIMDSFAKVSWLSCIMFYE